MIAALRRLPAPLLFAQLGAIAITLVFEWNVGGGALNTLLTGIWVAFDVLSIVGYAWLARQLTGKARLGVRVAFGASLLALVLQLADLALIAYRVVDGSNSSSMMGETFLSTAESTLRVLSAIGLGIAAGRWYWVALGAIVAFVAAPPWFLLGPMHDWAGEFRRTVHFTYGLAAAVTTLVMTVRACSAATAEARPVAGMRRIELALYGQVVATVALLGFTLLLDNPIAVVIATALEGACIVVLALGALDASGALARWLAIASAAAALSVAGTMRGRVLGLVLRYFGPSDFRWSGPQPTFTLAISGQLVVACAIAGLLVALAIAARRRGLEALRARIYTRIGAFVALSLGAITAQDALGPPSELTQLGLAMLVAANTALIASWIIAARAVRAAGDFAADSNLPAATLMKG